MLFRRRNGDLSRKRQATRARGGIGTAIRILVVSLEMHVQMTWLHLMLRVNNASGDRSDRDDDGKGKATAEYPV